MLGTEAEAAVAAAVAEARAAAAAAPEEPAAAPDRREAAREGGEVARAVSPTATPMRETTPAQAMARRREAPAGATARRLPRRGERRVCLPRSVSWGCFARGRGAGIGASAHETTTEGCG